MLMAGDVAEKDPLAIEAVQRQQLEVGREPRRLGLPVWQYAGRSDDQRRLIEAAFRLLPHQEGQRLYGLAEAHVVGKHATEPVPAQEVEPGQPLLLVGPELCLERGRWPHGLEEATASERFTESDQPFGARRPSHIVTERGRGRRQRRSLGAVQAHLAVLQRIGARSN